MSDGEQVPNEIHPFEVTPPLTTMEEEVKRVYANEGPLNGANLYLAHLQYSTKFPEGKTIMTDSRQLGLLGARDFCVKPAHINIDVRRKQDVFNFIQEELLTTPGIDGSEAPPVVEDRIYKSLVRDCPPSIPGIERHHYLLARALSEKDPQVIETAQAIFQYMSCWCTENISTRGLEAAEDRLDNAIRREQRNPIDEERVQLLTDLGKMTWNYGRLD